MASKILYLNKNNKFFVLWILKKKLSFDSSIKIILKFLEFASFVIYCPNTIERKAIYQSIENLNKVAVGYYDKTRMSEERYYGVCSECQAYNKISSTKISKWKNLDYCHALSDGRETLYTCYDCTDLMDSEFRTKSYHKNNCLVIGNSFEEIIEYAKENNIPLRSFRKSRLIRKNVRQKNKKNKIPIINWVNILY